MIRTTIAILNAAPDTYILTVTIGTEEYDLGTYSDAEGAAAHMVRWVRDRGLTFGPDTAQRVNEVQRRDSAMLILDVITTAEHDRLTAPARMAWVDHASDYIWPL